MEKEMETSMQPFAESVFMQGFGVFPFGMKRASG